MGYSDIEPYGATDIRTPSISRLADEGVKFTNFYAAAPVCGPARAALYTGRYPAAIGFEQNIRTEDDGLDASVPTLSRWLVDAGYRTALYGKWHLGLRAATQPSRRMAMSPSSAICTGRSATTATLTIAANLACMTMTGLSIEMGYLTDILSDEAVAFHRTGRATIRFF